MAEKSRHFNSVNTLTLNPEGSLTPFQSYTSQTSEQLNPVDTPSSLIHSARIESPIPSSSVSELLTPHHSISDSQIIIDSIPVDDSLLGVTLTPSAFHTPSTLANVRREAAQALEAMVHYDHTFAVRTTPAIGHDHNPIDRNATDRTGAHATATSHPSEVIRLRPHPRLTPEGFTVSIREHIGEGGTAIVNRATQNLLDRDVALKRLKPSAQDSSIAQFMLKEAQLMARLDHPNIPPIYQIAFDSTGVPLILMKHVKGTSWDVLISDPHHAHWERHPSDQLRTHLEMLVKICFAVEYAHEKEIIHCDIKASNVMIGDFGEVFLLDWGLAIELNHVDQQRVMGFYGSPRYAAPEMFTSGAELTKKTDVYLLGATLHHILTKEPLHQGSNLREVVAFARRSLRHQYPPSVHPMLVQMIHRATDPDPDKRFSSVNEFREALEAHLSHYATLDMVSEMREKISELEQRLDQLSGDDFHFYELAFECRFGVKHALEVFPDDHELKRDLRRVLICQAQYELAQDRLEMPPRLLEEIKSLDATSEEVTSLEAQIQSAKLRSSELAVQIQYKLLEELQRAKAASPTSPSLSTVDTQDDL